MRVDSKKILFRECPPLPYLLRAWINTPPPPPRHLKVWIRHCTVSKKRQTRLKLLYDRF